MEDEFGRDALAVHVGHSQHGVVQPVPAGDVGFTVLRERCLRLHACLQHQHRDGVDLVVLVEVLDQVVEPGVHVLGPQLLRDAGVAVRRDDDQPLVHW